MSTFVIKVSPGYGTKYYSTVGTVISALENLNFASFESANVEIFIKPGHIVDEQAILDFLKRNSTVARQVFCEERDEWKKTIRKEFELIMAGENHG